LVLGEHSLLGLVGPPGAAAVTLSREGWSHRGWRLLAIADGPGLILGLGLDEVGITSVSLWVQALCQCSDEFPLEGDDILGCWLSEWFSLW